MLGGEPDQRRGVLANARAVPERLAHHAGVVKDEGLSRGVQRWIAIAGRHAEQRGEQGHDLVRRGAPAVEQRLDPGQLLLGRRAAVAARLAPQQPDHRMEPAVGVIGRAGVAQRRMRLAAEVIAQGADHARLADSRLARE
jgi:hypothetical protein